MEKKTLYALAALVVLSVLAVLVLRSPEQGERVGERPRPIPEIAPGSITTLEITQPGGKDQVVLSKRGDKWQVTSPYDKPADTSAVKLVVEALEKLRWGDITTQQKARHDELEVTPDKAVRVVAKDSAGKVLADLYLGKMTGSAVMVRLEGKDEVWQAFDLSTWTFKKESKQWREHAVIDEKADEAEKVSIVGGGASVYLERLPPPKGADGKEPTTQNIYDAKWKVVDPPQPDPKAIKPDPSKVVDDGLINSLVQGVATLRAGEFLDTAKPEEVGLAEGAPGQIEVKVTFKGGKTAGVRIGTRKGEDYHVQVLGNPQIFTVKAYSLERIAHLPQDIRDKTITQIKEDQLEQVTVQQDKDVLVLRRVDGKWKADKIAETDEDKAKSLVESFGTLTAYGFVAPGTPELASLAKPKATVTLKVKGGAPVVLKIGQARGEEVIAQRVGMEPVWLKKYNADRFLKKPEDLKKESK
ncbi:MAG: DUF4340 domain-containing protein [Myxococcales bacterium]|nr:DUF4340 domain-containing protein [Myxococcota bacterium]MDW8283917.1 DUF4340 domain-containing protein [Myxococcales bacterium]